jgi:cyanoexosortase B-associated protein
MTSPHRKAVNFSQRIQRSPRYKILLAMLILAIAVAGVIPNYWSGNWTWKQSLELKPIQALKTIQQQGLLLPGWQTIEQQVVQVGGHKWSMQTLTPDAPDSTTPQPSALLMLRPQTWHRDLPQVDWMDINGARGWTEDSQRRLSFTLPPIAPESSRSISVNARFFRGWDQERTYAVVQWYAWPSGGHAAPSRWFWVDQVSQWRDRQRTPWVAVSLLIPIKPLGDIESARSQAISLAQLAQSTLTQSLLPESPSLPQP